MNNNLLSYDRATDNALFSARDRHSSVVFNNRMWIIAGESSGSVHNDVYYSNDGISWILVTSSATFPARYGHASTVHDNKMWIAGGQNGINFNDVWYSSDGINWIQGESFSGARHALQLVSFNSNLWIIAGNTGVVTDGGFNKNDVLSSVDGITTILRVVINNASFRKRS